MHYIPLSGVAGKLAFGARPRSRADLDGFGLVISLLTDEEIAEVDLGWLEAVRLPIADRGCPPDRAIFTKAVEQASAALRRGEQVYVHCRAGIGRAGLFTACLLNHMGCQQPLWELLTAVRGVPVPDTDEQKEWVENYWTRATGVATLDEALHKCTSQDQG